MGICLLPGAEDKGGDVNHVGTTTVDDVGIVFMPEKFVPNLFHCHNIKKFLHSFQ